MHIRPLFLFSLLLFSCKSKVEKIKPELAPISESVYASGIVKSKDQYQAFAAVSGIIQEVFVEDGDKIKAGDPILRIDDETQKLGRENAELAARYSDYAANSGRITDAREAAEVARIKLQTDSLLYIRQKNLWTQNIGTRAELEQRELSYRNSRNLYNSALQRSQDLERQLAFNSGQARKNLLISDKLEREFTLRSKLNGVVYTVLKSKGELVGPQTPLAVVGSANEFVLEMNVDEYDILKVKEGMSVMVSLDSYKGKVFSAMVSKINPLMNERTKSFLVEAKFTGQPPVLYPNISFEANIVIQSKDKALLIPRNYLLNDSTVVLADGEERRVRTGLMDYRKAEIISGLSAADELIKPGP